MFARPGQSLVTRGGRRIAIAAAPSAYDIIILAGQSNMAGRGLPRSGSLDIDDPNVDQFGGYLSGSLYRTIGNDITWLQHPDVVANEDRVGVGEYIGRTYAAANPGRKVLLVPVAEGGTRLVGNTWQAGTPGGARYEFAIAQANLAVTAAQAVNPASAVVGIAWIQGESDGDNAVTTANYLTALNNVIAGLRARITGATNAWFLIGSMVPEAILTRSGYPEIDIAHMRATLANTRTIFQRGPKAVTSDNLHYSLAGTRLFGPTLANALPRAAKAEVIYDFESDAAAATTVIGVTSDNSTGTTNTPLINAGATNRLTSSGSGSVPNTFGVLFEAVPPLQTDIVVEWTETFTANQRSGLTLRAQAAAPSTNGGRDGYLFMSRKDVSGFRIYRVHSGGTVIQIAGVDGITPVSGWRLRCSAIGTALTFEYSTNGGVSWSTACSTTDANYASGRLAYVQGFGVATAGAQFIDNVSIRNAL